MSSATDTKPNPDVIDGDAREVLDQNALAIRNADPAVFHALDAADEKQIIQDLKGKALKKWVYEFKVGGKWVRDLSYAGVNAAVRDLNARGVTRISCPPEPKPEFTEIVDDGGEPAIECMVYALDKIGDGGGWGLATQRRFEKTHQSNCASKRDRGRCDCTMADGPDRYAKTKALSKAQRNAKRSLVPEEFVAALVAAAAGHEVQRIKVPNLTEDRIDQAKAETPKPRESRSDRAPEMNATIEKLCGELDYLPGKTKALLAGASTIKAKESLIARLNGELDTKAAKP